jgi:hypothetical protein
MRPAKAEGGRLALEGYLAPERRPKGVTMLDIIGDLAGSFRGGPCDLATNPKYMEDLGNDSMGHRCAGTIGTQFDALSNYSCFRAPIVRQLRQSRGLGVADRALAANGKVNPLATLRAAAGEAGIVPPRAN